MRLTFACLVVLMCAPARAAEPDDSAIRAVIAQWYTELGRKEEGRIGELVSPGLIEASPHYEYLDNGSAALGPIVYTSLPANALQFRFDIEAIRVDPNFARVAVWERGYFYAYAAQATYELAAEADFLLEREPQGGRWLIAAHRSENVGIPPNKVTTPMPDLRDLFYATEGQKRDPHEDAHRLGKF